MARSPLSLQEERDLLKREKYGLNPDLIVAFSIISTLVTSVVSQRPVCHICWITSRNPPPLFFIQCLVCRTKFAQQAGSPLPAPLDPCTPTKSGLRTGSKGTPDVQAPCPEPPKVTFSVELDLLAELYYTCISGKQPQDGINEPKTEKLFTCVPFHNPNRLVTTFVTYNNVLQKILSQTFSWSFSSWSSYWLLSLLILVKINWRNHVQQVQVWTKFMYTLCPHHVVT